VEETPTEEPPVTETPAEETPDTAAVGLRAEYFALKAWSVSTLAEIDFSATPTATGTVQSLNMLGGSDAFWVGGAEDHFAARYTGDLNVTKAGSYTFFLNSDDGSALYIDGQRVIDNDGAHATTQKTVTLDLTAGAHEIEIRYFELAGGQTLALDWQGPDSNGARVNLSGNSLSHGGAAEPVEETPTEEPPVTETPAEETPDTAAHTDTGTGMDHGGHGDSAITPPLTAAAADAFVAAVKAQADSHAHGDNSGKATEHEAVLALVPRSEATHVAIGNGDWSDPGTWYQGKIPGADAKVLIPEGISVTYDLVSNASLFTVRVDGELSFATETDTKMLVDTLVVSPMGRLEIGTEENPIQNGVTADIVIADNGDINVGWDPMLLSRGVVSHGAVEIYGQEKTAFLTVDNAPMSGATTINLSEVPQGWQVGDTIVITGTHKQGWYWDNNIRDVIYHESEDEEVTITAINGSTITIDQSLKYDHDAPRDDLAAYVSNMTRTITIASENGEATEVHHRGHVMFMHSDDVDVRYAAFDDLGRTDKSEAAFDVGSVANVESDTNIKGRYSFHFHKTGTDDLENPAISIGNTVSGSPGWGFVHHSSNANFIGNVAFDVFGAAFAAEDGDETGIWQGNMAIRSEGIGYGAWAVKHADDVARHDNGRTGDGFFFAGRLVEASDNVAANTTNGYVWMHRSAPSDPAAANLDHPEIAYGNETMNVDQAAIQGFHNNEAFGTETGLIVIKANPAQNHDVRSIFDGFLNWETSEGVNLSYTAHYTLKDFDLLSTDGTYANGLGIGVNIGGNAFDMVFNGLTIEGFDTGVDLDQSFTFANGNSSVNHVLIDVKLIDVGQGYVGLNSARQTIMDSGKLTEGRLEFTLTGSSTLSEGQSFSLAGIKTDSIGSHARQYDGDPQVLTWNDHIAPLIVNEGYYRTTDGRNVILIEDFVADRATGELYKFAHVVTLNMSEAQIANNWSVQNWGGAIFNGTITFDGVAPTASDDFALTRMGQDILIDVLANDYDAMGDAVRVDGTTNPEHGWVYEQDDGSLLYRPHEGFSGTDTFDYWAADSEGLFTKATVTVTVDG
jgi:hypothetical protein